MSETAFQCFFSTAQADDLPAAVPVASEGGLTGIITSRFDVRLNEDALAVATSDDPHQRALAALYACASTRESVSVQYPDLFAV